MKDMSLTKRQYNKIIKQVRIIYLKTNDPFHNMDHALITANLAADIAKKEKADAEICRVAGLLHDIAPKKRGQPHGRQSAILAKKLLRTIINDKRFINKVAAAIVNHDTRNSHLISAKEGKIIFEADKLQVIGPIGIFREFGDLLILGHGKRSATITIDFLKNYDHPFFTQTGRKLKKELLNFNNNFVKYYDKYMRYNQ
ncbi:MAG: HD domain-containing protein [Patescibacteria group bacterium]